MSNLSSPKHVIVLMVDYSASMTEVFRSLQRVLTRFATAVELLGLADMGVLVYSDYDLARGRMLLVSDRDSGNIVGAGLWTV
jgi:hypothetical protein